jgi:hypothetical protein
MPVWHLSQGCLQEIPEHLIVLDMRDVLGSDWGHPTRILETLRTIGKPPNFSCDELKEY